MSSREIRTSTAGTRRHGLGRGTKAATLGCALALVLAACGSSDDEAGDPTGSPSSQSPASSVSDPAGSPSSGLPSTTATPSAAPTATSPQDGIRPEGTDPSTAIEPAVLALMTWGRPTVAYDQWWAELSPFLDDRALEAYVATDPTVLPDIAASIDMSAAPATLAPETGSGHVVVDVPSTAGVFGVQMTWSSDPETPQRRAGWLVDRIYFPDSPRE